MHITVEPRESYAILYLSGEFDTYYVPALQTEIDKLIKAGVTSAVLNLRLVKFINSTALGAIIKGSKQFSSAGGKLTIAHPSKFCRDIFQKVGLDRVVPVFDTDEEAASQLGGAAATSAGSDDEAFREDESSVIFRPVDSQRVEHFIESSDKVVNPVHGHAFGDNWSGIGRMAGLDEASVRFTWSGGQTGLDVFAMGQLLALGTDWKIKFRLPLLKKGHCEAVATISEVEERGDGIKIKADFKEIDDATRGSVRQYAADMSYLKDELRRATDA
ncbi:MAG: anti-anti-sigma factor [Candidatus Paceibacteria bacterium]|jgi:anti-anti-sigma factor